MHRLGLWLLRMHVGLCLSVHLLHTIHLETAVSRQEACSFSHPACIDPRLLPVHHETRGKCQCDTAGRHTADGTHPGSSTPLDSDHPPTSSLQLSQSASPAPNGL